MSKKLGELNREVGLDQLSQDNILIVDALNLCFRYKHSGKTEFAVDFVKTINSLARSYDCGQVIITADKGSSAFRKSVDPNYKGGRKDKYEKQTEEEAEAFKAFIEGYEKALTFAERSFPILRFDRTEADDIAAYLVLKLKDEDSINKIWLISTDKDWDQLLTPYVSRFSYITRKEYTVANFAEHHDCETPEEYTSVKVLMGDSGDSVPGFDNVGPKRAAALLREYGSALDIYDSIPLSGSQKYIKSINADPDRILTNYELMDLLGFCTDAINFSERNTEIIDETIERILEKADNVY